MTASKKANVEKKMAAERQAKFREKAAADGLKRAGFMISDSVMSELRRRQDEQSYTSINQIIFDLLHRSEEVEKIIEVEKIVERIVHIDKIVQVEKRIEVNVLNAEQKAFIEQAEIMLNAFANYQDNHSTETGKRWGIETSKLSKMQF